MRRLSCLNVWLRTRAGTARSQHGPSPSSRTDKNLAALLHPSSFQSFYLILNLALGTEGTQFTTNHNGGVPVTEEQLRLALQSAAGQAARMEVDWVRVFGQRDP